MKKTLLKWTAKLAVALAGLAAAGASIYYGFTSFVDNPTVESVSAASGVAPATMLLCILGGLALLILASWNPDPRSRRRRRYSYPARRRRRW